MDTYGAFAYSTSSDDPKYAYELAPTVFELRIDLAYEDGSRTAFVYERELPTEQEQKELMLSLQIGAGKYGYTITRTEADGSTINVEPIG